MFRLFFVVTVGAVFKFLVRRGDCADDSASHGVTGLRGVFFGVDGGGVGHSVMLCRVASDPSRCALWANLRIRDSNSVPSPLQGQG